MTRRPDVLRALRATPGLWRVAATLPRHGILGALRAGGAFLITEGVFRAVDPELDVFQLFREELQAMKARRFRPEDLARRMTELGVGLEALFRESPGDARRVLRRLADGTLGRLQAPELEALLARGTRSVDRLTGGAVATAFVVDGALLTGLDGWHHRTGVILLGAGVLLALAIGIGALRQGRGR